MFGVLSFKYVNRWHTEIFKILEVFFGVFNFEYGFYLWVFPVQMLSLIYLLDIGYLLSYLFFFLSSDISMI
jgi:hypothetical protein